MAKIAELNEEGWKEWVATRPPVVQDLCRKYPPDRLYRMQPTGSRVTLVSYSENGTVTVLVGGDWNLTMFQRKVFGVDPANLEECDLPEDDEPLGALLTTRKEIDAYCDIVCADMNTGSNAEVRGDAPPYGAASLTTDGLCNGG